MGIICAYCLIVTFIYLLVWQNPIIHEIANGIQVFFIVVESLLLQHKYKSTKRILLMCSIYYFLGFFFWNLDNHFCSSLKSYRNVLDTNFGIDGASNLRSVIFNVLVLFFKSLLQFHSIWHILTGFGSYSTILFIVEGNYQLHLTKNKNLKKSEVQVKNLLGSRFNKCYYHLSNDLISKVKNI